MLGSQNETLTLRGERKKWQLLAGSCSPSQRVVSLERSREDLKEPEPTRPEVRAGTNS